MWSFARYQLATIAVTIFEGIDFHQEKGEIKVVTFQNLFKKRSNFLDVHSDDSLVFPSYNRNNIRLNLYNRFWHLQIHIGHSTEPLLLDENFPVVTCSSCLICSIFSVLSSFAQGRTGNLNPHCCCFDSDCHLLLKGCCYWCRTFARAQSFLCTADCWRTGNDGVTAESGFCG